jgi:DNA polymerase III epsilon subunit-like protein
MSAVPPWLPTAEAILADTASSSWIRTALTSALERDPVDALNDALALAAVLDAQLRRKLELEEVP